MTAAISAPPRAVTNGDHEVTWRDGTWVNLCTGKATKGAVYPATLSAIRCPRCKTHTYTGAAS